MCPIHLTAALLALEVGRANVVWNSSKSGGYRDSTTERGQKHETYSLELSVLWTHGMSGYPRYAVPGLNAYRRHSHHDSQDGMACLEQKLRRDPVSYRRHTGRICGIGWASKEKVARHRCFRGRAVFASVFHGELVVNVPFHYKDS